MQSPRFRCQPVSRITLRSHDLKVCPQSCFPPSASHYDGPKRVPGSCEVQTIECKASIRGYGLSASQATCGFSPGLTSDSNCADSTERLRLNGDTVISPFGGTCSNQWIRLNVFGKRNRIPSYSRNRRPRFKFAQGFEKLPEGPSSVPINV